MNFDPSQLTNKIKESTLRNPLSKNISYKSCKDMGCNHKTSLKISKSYRVVFDYASCSWLWLVTIQLHRNVNLDFKITKYDFHPNSFKCTHTLSKDSKFNFYNGMRYSLFCFFFACLGYQTFSNKHSMPISRFFVSNRTSIVCISINLHGQSVFFPSQ